MEEKIKHIPTTPGIYFFKDENNNILYIGKAKNLKKRVSSYFQKQHPDWKTNALVNCIQNIDYIATKTELEAMLLEAELIQANQPKFNVLLKSGQPFLYIVITSPPRKLPELKIVRNKKEKGTYFGPFLEKTPARKVYHFLIKTFHLKICKKKIENGCLDYHLGICAGSCRPDFDKAGYLHRLELAKKSLKQGHKKFLRYLEQEINTHNKKLEFEKSQELHEYYKAFKHVFEAINTTTGYKTKTLAQKDIWILTKDKTRLFLFSEVRGAIKKKREFVFLTEDFKNYIDYFIGYYRNFSCPNHILINFDIKTKDKTLFETFLKKWHKKQFDVSIIYPTEGHFYNLLKLATIHADQEIVKQKTLPQALKKLLKLKKEPHTIDCFDISHKQGMFMVGSCIRFTNGTPDKEYFRRFKIKTVETQDDYACLQEIVQRRYKNIHHIPDLILIDGGKGQLNAIITILPEAEICSLAKREERIFSKNLPEGKRLNIQHYADQILIALRDYAHHFAISYHRKLQHQTLS
jgi:excinuclease ABC subunit C